MTARIVHDPSGIIIVSQGVNCVSGTAIELQSFARLILAALMQTREGERQPLVPPVYTLDI